VSARVRTVQTAAAGVRSFDIVPEGGARTYAPGSHINVSVLISDEPDVRSYSLVGRLPVNGAYRIAVKRLPDSRGGSAYMSTLQPGAHLMITEPASHFELQFGHPEYLLLAGGIGITPLVGMAEALNRGSAPFRLAYAGRSRSEMPFVEQLAAMLGERLDLFVSDEGRRVDLLTEIGQLHPDGELYVCGPVRMRNAAFRAWADQGREAVRMRFETFASGGRRPSRAFVVRVDELGVEVAVPENRSMLEALRDAGVEVMWDCLRGECGLCAVPVLAADGDIDHRDVFLSVEQQAQGAVICTCVSRVVGGGITIGAGLRSDLAPRRP